MYTDIHSHVIWGVDDGAEAEEETFRMLREAAEDGISRIICTPHVTPGVWEFPEERFQEHFRKAEEYIAREGLGILLQAGAEVLYTDSTPRLIREGKIATLAGTRYLLVEFSPTDTKDHIYGAVQKIAGTGMIPVIAHMERYPCIRKAGEARELKQRFGAMIQINARSLVRKQPLLRRKFFDSLFREGLCDFIATDTHAMEGRGTCMKAGVEAVRQKYGEEPARKITRMPDQIR